MTVIDNFQKKIRLALTLGIGDTKRRYSGSIFGLIWIIANPLFYLSIYSLVFGLVLKVKWPGSSDNIFEFIAMLFCGLLIHGTFTEVINRSAQVITDNTNYVKKVVFPLEVLPVSLVIGSLFQFIAGFILLILLCFISGFAGWNFLFFVVPVACVITMAMGISLFIAAIGVYLRDLSQITGMATTLMLFLSPVLYPLESLPQAVVRIVYLNPITIPVIELRKVVVMNSAPDFSILSVYAICALTVLLAGYGFFMKLRRGFADVM